MSPSIHVNSRQSDIGAKGNDLIIILRSVVSKDEFPQHVKRCIRGLSYLSFPVEPEMEFLCDYLLPLANGDPYHSHRLRVRATTRTHDARGCQRVIDIERADRS